MERTKLICLICNKEFYPKSGHLKQKTCSKKCGYKLRSINPNKKKGRHYPHLQKKPDGKCLTCGKEYKKRTSKSKYCSKDCWNHRNPPKLKKCNFCGKEFMTYERETKIYCTIKCRNKDYQKRFKAENSHFWKGGLTAKNKLLRTNSKFKEWREAIFKRDNYTCKKCGARQVELHPHHIKHLAKYPELAYDVWNGITLCKECHLKEHKHKFGGK